MSRTAMKQHRMMLGALFPCTEAGPQEEEGRDEAGWLSSRNPLEKHFWFCFSGLFLDDYLFLYDEI